jgi:Zn-dependent M28 family amino/carboxypeptidase
VIAPGTADRLRERLQRGDTLELEVEIDSRAFDTTMPLLSGVLPGRDPREVVVISHLCHPRPSANDNASGVAANFEAARVLAERARSGGARASARGLRFLWVPELTGTHAFFGREPRHAERIVAALNLDMVGRTRTGAEARSCSSILRCGPPPSPRPCWRGSEPRRWIGSRPTPDPATTP